ncbi:DNA cytosine methyltransferase [Streptomyces sp. SID14478]|uniref:DNA cytosine methyltransferase n=1 Tax=Streptomyces sp. SID14478 TaxID=2706073 RepID=UPI0013D95CE0|nr:DNA cytosine methyltransferase [Streptomyces sp. SID14478]NEB78922.1 DNA cytosine methyltransferase [Streptomyces sp. SID14478]
MCRCFCRRCTVGVILSPPCPSFSTAGKRAGILAANIDILRDAIAAVGEAAGFIRLDEVCCDELFPDLDDDCRLCADLGYHEGYAPRTGQSWAQVHDMLDDLTDPRIGLMLEVVLWPLGLQAASAPIQWMAMEQSSNLPEEILDELSVEFGCADWFRTSWAVLESADLGIASRRKRVFMLASRFRWVDLTPPAHKLPFTAMAKRSTGTRASVSTPAGSAPPTRPPGAPRAGTASPRTIRHGA